MFCESGPRSALEHVDAQHPPDKKQRNDGEYDVADPLDWRFRLAEFEHSTILNREVTTL